MNEPSEDFHVGFFMFPGLTQLDLTGPYEVFARMPRCKTHIVAKTLDPVRSESRLTLLPTTTVDRVGKLDLICVPGGRGIDRLLDDDSVLEFLRRTAEHARYVTSVCTGALLLGAAGLLRGYKATTHWLSLDLLPLFEAEPVRARVVIDRNRITGGGVTAGVDFALWVAALVHGEAVAREIQLVLEYDPEPPFASGSPESADPVTVAAIEQGRAESRAERRRLVAKAAARMHT